MKNLTLVLFFSFICSMAFSQSRKVSNEKLLNYYQTGQYLEAAAYLKNIYGENTENPRGLAKFGYAYLMANKLREAESNYLKLLAIDGNNAAALTGLGAINAKRHLHAAALGYYRQALNLDTTDYQVYRQLGLLNTADTAAKRNFLSKANQLNPADPQLAIELSDIYIHKKDFGTAEDILEMALSADSTNLQLLKKMMPVSIGMKKYRNAIATGEKILAQKDSSSIVLNNLGKSYYAMFEFSKALKCFTSIKDIPIEQQEELLYNIATCYRELRDYKNEEKYLDLAIRQGISQKTATYYGLLGDSFDNRNMSKEAMEAYKKGLQFENTGSLLYSIALLYENKLNDKKNAIDYYNQYLKTLDPKEKPKLIKFITSKIAELTERSKK